MPSIAFITGASSGIGEALADLLSQKGYRVILSGRNETKLKEIAERVGALDSVVADLATEEGIEKVNAAIEQHAPELLINNAGFSLYGDVLTHELSILEDIVKVNSNAVLALTYTAAQTLLAKKKKGTILNVSSVASFPVFPGMAVYSAAKAFVNQLSLSMDYELKTQGIRVLAACPGVVQTAFRERAGGKNTDENAMSAQYAAEEIYKQIESGKSLHIFNWRYRVLAWLIRYILPQWLVADTVHKSIYTIQHD